MENMQCSHPVSYTHLDVYKRQTLDTMRWIAIEHREDVLAKQIEALSGMFRHVLNNGNEVTTVKEEVVHLKDVYKRQLSGSQYSQHY